MTYTQTDNAIEIRFDENGVTAIMPDSNKPLHIEFADHAAPTRVTHCASEYARLRGKRITYKHRGETYIIGY